MVAIARTRLGTSQSLSLCEGFALFPLGSARAEVFPYETPGASPLLAVHDATVLLWRLNAGFGLSLRTAVCGPAYAIEMDLEGSVDDAGVHLRVSDDTVAAGFFMGVTLGLNLAVTIDDLEVYAAWDGWSPRLESRWVRAKAMNLSAEIDLVNILFLVIKAVLAAAGKTDTLLYQVKNITPTLLASWGMLDRKQNALAAGNGTVTTDPTFYVPVDISSLEPNLAALNKAIQPLLCVSTGPQIGIRIPVTVTLDSITLDGQVEYTGLRYDGDEVHGTTTGATPAAVGTLGVRLRHTPGFDFTLGWFFNLNIAKLLNVGGSVDWPILSLLGIGVTLGTYENALESPVGATSAAAVAACGPPGELQLLDVVFEEPEVASR